MMNKVVIETNEELHIGRVSGVWSKVHVCMADEGLLEGVKGNNSASRVVECIRSLAQIRTPNYKTKASKIGLNIFEHMFFNNPDLRCNSSCGVGRDRETNLDKTSGPWV